jgi:hypothetical protein
MICMVHNIEWQVGRVVRLLSALGFTNVYNRCEDFYALQEAGRLPPHDVIVSQRVCMRETRRLLVADMREPCSPR